MQQSDPQWDERYASNERIWSGEPNGALVAEVAELAPGTALDVGCGEGADAIWLASRGWDVTAIDVSAVALERASVAAVEHDVTVHWALSGLLEADLPAEGFDLVSAQYLAVLKTPEQVAERALIGAVAPGGHLLVVHHVLDPETAASHSHDLSAYVIPRDVADLLDDTWHVVLDESRPRHLSSGAGAHHTHDVVLHARRTS